MKVITKRTGSFSGTHSRTGTRHSRVISSPEGVRFAYTNTPYPTELDYLSRP